jgi:tyrosyl-tRNA synthetase
MKRTLKLPHHYATIKNLPDLLLEVGLCKSRNEARKDIDGEGIYINNAKVPKNYSDLPIASILNENKLAANFVLLRKGKKKFVLLKVEMGL